MAISMFTARAGHDSRIITVSTNEQLNNALAKLDAGSGGTILLDSNAGPYTIWARDIGSKDAPILIRASDPSIRPMIEDIEIIDSSHITITEVHVEAAGDYGIRGATAGDVEILNSNKIEFVNSIVRGDADAMWTPDNPESNSGGLVRNSTNVTIAHNEFSNLGTGFGYLEVVGLNISNNEFFGIQGDGLRGGGLQDALISNNYMHDFYGSTQDVNHTDFIQIWGTNATMLTRNVEISGNILDTSGGAASQSIFIRNEEFGNGTANGGYFQDIRILDNVIHNAEWNGITVSDTRGLVVNNNTVLWDEASTVLGVVGGERSFGLPRIDVQNSPGARVLDNIGSAIYVEGADVSGDNYLINYDDPASPNYVHNHFMNLSGTGNLALYDLMLVGDSPLFGVMGAKASSYLGKASDGLTAVFRAEHLVGNRMGVELSAEFSMDGGSYIDPDTARVSWYFSDGSVKEGVTLNHVFDTPGRHVVKMNVTKADGQTDSVKRVVNVEDYANIELDFSKNAADVSGRDSVFQILGADGDEFVAGRDGQAFHIDGTSIIAFSNENKHLYSMDTLNIDLGFRLDSAASTGALVNMHDTLRLEVRPGGMLQFTLQTNEGVFTVTSASNLVADTKWHDVTVDFDGPDKSLSLKLDGKIVGEVVATGTTAPTSTQMLVLGDTWGNDAHSIVDKFVVSSPRTSFEGFEYRLDIDTIDETKVLKYDAKVVETEVGDAIRMDGELDFARLGVIDEVEDSDTLTVALEFKSEDMGDRKQRLFTKQKEIAVLAKDDTLIVKVDQADKSLHKSKFVLDGLSLQEAKLHNLTLLLDADDDHLQVFLDGVLILDESDADFTLSEDSLNNSNWILGAKGMKLDLAFKGDITDFSVENDAEFIDMDDFVIGQDMLFV